MSFKRGLCLASALSLSLFWAGDVQAQKVKVLDEGNIHRFIERTTVMAKGKGAQFDMSVDDIVKYFDHHIDKGARFSTTMSYAVPGLRQQVQKIVIDKDDFIETVQKAEGAMHNYKVSIDVKSIKISEDKTRATVSMVSRESGELPVRDNDGHILATPIEGVSTCSQVLILKRGRIKMFSADCDTEMSFLSLNGNNVDFSSFGKVALP